MKDKITILLEVVEAEAQGNSAEEFISYTKLINLLKVTQKLYLREVDKSKWS